MDNRLALITGVDIPIPECGITIHQPNMLEISMFGEEEFFKCVQTLTIDKSMFDKDKMDLSNYNNFQIFMMVINEPEAKEIKRLIQDFFVLIFPHYKVNLTPRSIMVMDESEMKMIDDQNFDYLQHIIKLIFCLYDKKEGEEIEYNIDENNKRAKEIKEKILRGRERVAKLKHVDEQSIFSIYMSMISVALNISLLVLNQYTMFQLFDTVERYSLRVNYDLDIQARMAGAKMDKPIENWTKNIHKYYV